MQLELSQSQVAEFEDQGYLVFDSLLDATEIDSFKHGVDTWINRHANAEALGATPVRFVFEIPELGPIVVHEKVLAIVQDLLGAEFYFHHLHASKHVAGAGPANWHQDYEQHPQTNRRHPMCHVFFYLNGLNGTIGDLLLVPGSQKTVIDRGALSRFGTRDLPDTTVVNDLAPGSAIVVHSAVWHARRAMPGGEESPRYFIDSSYCQAGIRWPGYPNYEQMCRRAFEIGLVSDQRYGHLFRAKNYFDGGAAAAVLAGLDGSLVLETKAWKE